MKLYTFIFCLIFFSKTVFGEIGNTSFNTKSDWAFEENKGQIKGVDADKVNFILKENNLTMYLLKTGIAYQFNKTTYPKNYKPISRYSKKSEKEDWIKAQSEIKLETYRMDIELVNANINAVISKENISSNYIQYYNFNITGVHSYSKITYHDIYPNIDWIIYKNDQGVKYDFFVKPGGNVNDIIIKLKHVETINLKENGNLELGNRIGNVEEIAPKSIQEDKIIKTKFKLKNDIVKFDVSKYDHSNNLTIDPSILWSTYFGASDVENAESCAVDKNGNVFLVGYTGSNSNIANAGYQMTFGAGYVDAYIVKFNSVGTRLWSTYYGNSDLDWGYYCSVDTFGNIYLCGSTQSSFMAGGGHQNTYGGNGDAYLVKFNTNGVFQWATYYGTGNADDGYCCAADLAGNIYLSGATGSTSNISSGGHQDTAGGWYDAFLVKFNSAGVRQWGTYYGGSDHDYGFGCTVDKNNNVYMSGLTNSNTKIAFNGHQSINQGNGDAFLVKFNSAGVRQCGTFYGGIQNDDSYSCTADLLGNVYLSGSSSSVSNIAFNGHDNSYNGGGDAYLAKFNSTGVRQWGTYYGDTVYEKGNFTTTDSIGNIYLGGNSGSTINIASSGFQNSYGGGFYDAFLVKFNTAGQRKWGTYFGGSDIDEGLGCFMPNNDIFYLCGQTASSFNIASNGFKNYLSGQHDGFLTKILVNKYATINIFKNTSDTICSGTQINLTSSITNGGSNPKYKWFKNGNLIDSNNSLQTNNISNGDSIQCLLISSDSSVTKDSVWSKIFKFSVKQKTSFIQNKSICIGQSYLFNNNILTSSGIYYDTLTNIYGCDSFITLILNVGDLSTNSNIFKTICSNSTFLFNNLLINKSGIYKDTLINNNGCDSFVFLNLTVKPNSYYSFSEIICQNQFFTFNGLNLVKNGIYLDTLINSEGCDSFISLNLIVLKSITKINQTICSGKSFLFNGVNRYTSGTYLDTFANILGCDSIIELFLTVKSPINTHIYNSICFNKPFIFKGKNLFSSGIYLDTLLSISGCDSIITLHLSVFQNSSSSITKSICPGNSYYFKRQLLTNSGIYRDTIPNSNRCDSIITLNLTVFPSKSIVITKLNDTLIGTNSFVKYQWFMNNTILSKDTNYKLTPFLSGIYYLRGTDNNNCTFNSNSLTLIKSLINNSQADIDILIYPIPAENSINIQSSMYKNQLVNIKIIALNGKIVESSQVKFNSNLFNYNVSHLPKGNYIIEITSSLKEICTSKKITIE